MVYDSFKQVWNYSFTEHRPYLKQRLRCSWRTVPSHSWRRRCRTLSMKVKRFATREQLTATLPPKTVRPSVQTYSEKPWKQTKKCICTPEQQHSTMIFFHWYFQYLSESCPARKDPIRTPKKKTVVVKGCFHWSLHTRSYWNMDIPTVNNEDFVGFLYRITSRASARSWKSTQYIKYILNTEFCHKRVDE